ncbi:MAG: O-antigen ligase family protein [Flavobacteriales bacterium]|nr:O-antigen ligase family protein [Flavobacteriales bacterium]
MPSLRSSTHSNVYLFGLMVMAVGLPSSNLLMTWAQLIIAANWFAEGDYLVKLKRFVSHKPALIFSSVFALHLVGLLYTSNWDYAAWDLQNKIPILVIPLLIISSPPLSKVRIDQVMKVFVSSVVIFSLVCAGELTPFNNWFRGLFGLGEREIIDARQISHFISHIRFSLMICLSIAWLMYGLIKKNISKVNSALHIGTAIWLFTFLFLLESMTGLAILFSLGFISILYVAIIQKNKLIKLSSLVILVVAPLLAINFVGNMIVDFYHVNEENVEELPKYTKSGGMYFHDLKNHQVENGTYVWRYVCHLELEPEWEKRSSIPFRGVDRVGQFVEYTIMRYMTSKGLRKDAEGLASLSDDDITNIENGVANAKYADPGSVEARIYGIIWEIEDYNAEGEPGGHSLSQRWEFWKTGVNVLKNNPLIGVGTGDIYDEMLVQYEADNSVVRSKYRKHPHNQFLSIAIAFGTIGLGIFLFALLYPIKLQWGHLDYVSLIFIAILLLSMTTEDTLETQAGVSFVAFFYSLLVLSNKAD